MLDLTWGRGDLWTDKLLELRTPNLDLFRPYAPSRSLAEFARRIEAAEGSTEPAVVRNLRRIQADFDPAQMIGLPVVLAEQPTGPFTIVEGMTRLSILCSKLLQSERVPERIRLLVGFGSRVRRWPYF